MIHSREHCLIEIAYYDRHDDGTVWAVYKPCEHGISETAVVTYPTFTQSKIAADQAATAKRLS